MRNASKLRHSERRTILIPPQKATAAHTESRFRFVSEYCIQQAALAINQSVNQSIDRVFDGHSRNNTTTIELFPRALAHSHHLRNFLFRIHLGHRRGRCLSCCHDLVGRGSVRAMSVLPRGSLALFKCIDLLETEVRQSENREIVWIGFLRRGERRGIDWMPHHKSVLLRGTPFACFREKEGRILGWSRGRGNGMRGFGGRCSSGTTIQYA